MSAKSMRMTSKARVSAAVVAALAWGTLGGCGSGGSGDAPSSREESPDASSAAESSESSESSESPGQESEEQTTPEEPEEPDSPCYDGRCEITVSEGTEIPVDRDEFGVTTIAVTSIEETNLGSFVTPTLVWDVYDGSENTGGFSCGVGSVCTTNDSLTVVPLDINVEAGTARLEITPEPPPS